MAEYILARLFEHNNWANDRVIEACASLTDQQLDAEPSSVTKGSIRQTLVHLVSSQQSYLNLLTLPVEDRRRESVPYAELQRSAGLSGEALLRLVRSDPGKNIQPRLETTDGYFVEPWVIFLQIINHASEHREQICSMLSALSITPPDLDGWAYGEATKALVPVTA